jgi:PAS domain S-box-containing protein
LIHVNAELEHLVAERTTALRESEQRLSTAQHYASVGTWEWDIATSRVTWSESYFNLYGLDPAVTTPSLENWIRSVHSEDREWADRHLRECMEIRAEDFRIEYRIQHSTKGERWLEGRGRFIYDTNGKPVRMIGVNIDVTERKRLDEALVRARDDAEQARAQAEEASQAKSRFLAAASHDLRQPVTAAGLYMDLLSRRLKNPEHLDLFDMIRLSLDGLLGLLNGLLEIARLEAGVVRPNMESVVLDDLLHRLSAEFDAQAKAARLWLHVPPCSSLISTDRLLLELILRNLLGNALKYTRRGGVSIEAIEEDGQVRVDVRDTGPGIPADVVGLIFDDFYQADELGGPSRGFGIGLATVRRVADVLGCRIEVQSEPGRGSTFSVFLPKAAEDPETHRRPEAPTAATLGRNLEGHTALMVEDDPLIGMALQLQLEEAGLSIARVGSVAAARSSLAGRTIPFDLVITDYQLGDGNGMEVIEMARGRWPAPAILLTGDTTPEVLVQAEEAGVVLVSKPFQSSVLQQTIAELLVSDGLVSDG